MASTATLEAGIDRIAAAGLDHVALRQEAAAVLRRHVDFDVAVWATVDPTTVMWTHCLLDGMPRDEALEAAVFANEYGQEDVLKLSELAHEGAAADSLVAATGGAPARSRRFAELYAPRGFDDELRAILTDARSPWGAVVLLRGGRPFSAGDAARVTAVAPALGSALRASLLREAVARPDAVDAPPGVLTVDREGRVQSVSEEAARILRDTRPGELPTAVAAVVARRRQGLPGRAIVPGRAGQLVGLQTADLGGGTVVIVERLRPFELADLIVRAHGLTDRERQVVECVARGWPTRRIAQTLHISRWTVQDHLKSIFAKFGVSSRQELVARVFFDHYAPEHEAGATPSPYGWFLDRGARGRR